MYHIFLIHSSVEGHLACFHVLAIVKSTAIDIRVYVCFEIFIFPGYVPRHGIVGSCSRSLFLVF